MSLGTRWGTIRRSGAAALAVGIGAFGIVAVSAPVAQAAGAACQQTFSSGTLNLAIPDSPSYGNPGFVAAPRVNVPEGLVVADLNLMLNINHDFVPDLSLVLFSQTDAGDPRGQSVVVNRLSRGGDDFVGTVLDDQAAIPLNWGQAPFTGRFLPNDRLSTFNGDSGGEYYLAAYDHAPGDTGAIKDWSMTISYVSCDFDGDNVEDHKDSCLGLSAATATGCPLTTRKLAAAYSSGKFKGRVTSPVAGCKASRPVTIYKVAGGPDKKIGTAKSRADGTFSLKRSKKAGRYYATTPLSAVTNKAQCPAAKSATFRIR